MPAIADYTALIDQLKQKLDVAKMIVLGNAAAITPPEGTSAEEINFLVQSDVQEDLQTIARAIAYVQQFATPLWAQVLVVPLNTDGTAPV